MKKDKVYLTNTQVSKQVMKENVCNMIKDIIKTKVDGIQLYYKSYNNDNNDS